jgi:hypothetical protein
MGKSSTDKVSLQAVRDLAEQTWLTLGEVDEVLVLKPGTFARLYRQNKSVRETWNKGRFALRIQTHKALAAKVKEADPKAVAAVKHLFGNPTDGAADRDFTRLTLADLERATGIHQRQLYRWHRERGMPRNADKSYSLPQFVEWHAQWEIGKLKSTKAPATNPMQAEKARLYRLQADEAEGRLLPRTDVIAMLQDRATRLVRLLSEQRAEDWSLAHEGQTAAQLKQAYVNAFMELRKLYCQSLEQIPLPDDA